MHEDTKGKAIGAEELDSITNDKVRGAVEQAVNRSRASRAVGGYHRSGHGSVVINQQTDSAPSDSELSEEL